MVEYHIALYLIIKKKNSAEWHIAPWKVHILQIHYNMQGVFSLSPHKNDSVPVGRATGRTSLMPTLFCQPMIRVPQSPWKVWPRHWISPEKRSSRLGFRELNATLWKKGGGGGLIQLSQDVVGYLQNPDLVFMDRSTSQSPPVDPLDNGRGDLGPFLFCLHHPTSSM